MLESLFNKFAGLKAPTQAFSSEICSRTKLYKNIKKYLFYLLYERPLKIMKNAFYFILKADFVLKIFKFLS